MYCVKCGNELKNNEQFCPNCGEKTNSTGKTVDLNISMSDITNKATNIKTNFVFGVSELGNNRNIILALLGLLVIGAVFVTMPIFSVNGMLGMSEKLSLFNYEGMRGLNPVSIILYIVSITCILFPLAMKKPFKPKYLLMSKITAFWTTIWFLFILFFSFDVINQYKGMANLSLTFAGWVLIISTVAIIVLSYMLSLRMKKILSSSNLVKDETTENIE